MSNFFCSAIQLATACGPFSSNRLRVPYDGLFSKLGGIFGTLAFACGIALP